jgi:hypothetical protein
MHSLRSPAKAGVQAGASRFSFFSSSQSARGRSWTPAFAGERVMND